MPSVSFKKISKFLIITLVFILLIFIFDRYSNHIKSEKPDYSHIEKIEKPKGKLLDEFISEENPITIPKPKIEIKESAILSMVYTCQAPYANWDIHEQSCEEAALLMVYYYLNDTNSFDSLTQIPKTIADSELKKMVDFQVTHYGDGIRDLNFEVFAGFVEDYYGYKYKISKNITENDIKKEVCSGNPVIVPVITHSLQNPHYGQSPSYHYLVIKGYDKNGVITNDAGVKEGEGWYYNWQILWQAIDAQTSWTGQGRDMIILHK